MVQAMSKKDLLRNQERPSVLGYDLDRETLTPVRQTVTRSDGDYGADPLGDGTVSLQFNESRVHPRDADAGGHISRNEWDSQRPTSGCACDRGR